MFEGDLFCLCRPVSWRGRWGLARSQPVSRQLPEIHSGQCLASLGGRWATAGVGMGNQQGKGGKRAAPGQTYPFDEPEKKSRTDWTAGNSRLI